MNRLSALKQSISGSPVTLDNLKCLKVTKEDLVGTIWLNSPANYNALSIQMLEEFSLVLPSLDNDSQVKVIVIRSKH